MSNSPPPTSGPFRYRRRLLPLLRGQISAVDLAVSFAAGVVALILVLVAVIGAPVESAAAVNIVLFVIGVAVHLSLGAAIGGVIADTAGGTLRSRLSRRLYGYTVGAAAVALVVAALTGLFWYVTIAYATLQWWLIGAAVLSLAAGFLVGHRAEKVKTSRAAKVISRVKNLTAQFAPTAGLVGTLAGLGVAVFLLWLSASVDTDTTRHAPRIVAVPAAEIFAEHPGYVAIGDSYSAGEGLDPQGSCHTSSSAYGHLLSDQEKGWPTPVFKACSGAVIEDVFNSTNLGPQVTGPPEPDVGLVTLTMGGNDALFSKVVVTCTEHPSCMWGNFPPSGVTEVDPVLRGASVPLDHVWAPATFTTIGNLLGAPGTGLYTKLEQHYPNARIVVLGYPYLFPDGPAPLTDLMCAAILRRVDQPDRAELRYLQDRFNELIFEETVRNGVGFINPNLLWAGHEPCGKHGQWTNSIEAYLNFSNPLGTGPFHPNSAGQQALADLVACYLHNNPSGAPPQAFNLPDTLISSSALTLADGAPFPHEWGTSSADFEGCGFGKVTGNVNG